MHCVIFYVTSSLKTDICSWKRNHTSARVILGRSASCMCHLWHFSDIMEWSVNFHDGNNCKPQSVLIVWMFTVVFVYKENKLIFHFHFQVQICIFGRFLVCPPRGWQNCDKNVFGVQQSTVIHIAVANRGVIVAAAHIYILADITSSSFNWPVASFVVWNNASDS